ncbi:hypothetical protein ABZ383_00275 [Streptomyces sp. NPDC005900]
MDAQRDDDGYAVVINSEERHSFRLLRRELPGRRPWPQRQGTTGGPDR